MKNKAFFFLVIIVIISACDETEIFTDPTTDLTLGGLDITNLEHPPLSENWEFYDAYSDEFNHADKTDTFSEKWRDDYHNAWNGPGLTEFTSMNSEVKDGNLVLSASRKTGTNRVYCGVVTSQQPITYPIYTEVRAKVANQVLSSNFWFLSPDDTREIDVFEIYASDRPDHTWFAARPSTNYHVFVRDPNTNAIINDYNEQKHHTLPGNEPWRNDWHRFGVYWKDAFTLDFYYDGKLVRQLRQDGITDPDGLGLDRESYMIMDLEDHAWRSNQGVTATDAELADDSDERKYRIDYVRTYRPIEAFDGGLVENGSFDNPELDHWYWKGNVGISTNFEANNGEAYTVQLSEAAQIIQTITVEPNTDYTLSLKMKNPNGSIKYGINELDIIIDNETSTEWQTKTLSFNSGERTTLYIMVENNSSEDVFVDAVKVE